MSLLIFSTSEECRRVEIEVCNTDGRGGKGGNGL